MNSLRCIRRVPAPSPLLGLLIGLLLAGSLAAQPIISEFMASNGNTLADEDGDFPDWIELHNPGAAAINLQGWHLTDDDGWLNQWRFPAVTLPAKGFLVVFASGKDRTNDVAHLHTNFSLDAAGDYLALVHPDGQTIAYTFGPAFPPQTRDVSFGYAQSSITNRLLSVGQSVRYQVPSDGTLGLTWTDPAFVDASWTSGTTGLGYETAVPGFVARNVKANTFVTNLTFAEQVLVNPALQTSSTTVNAPVINHYGSATDGHYGNNLAFPGMAVGVDYNDHVMEVLATLTLPSSGPWTFGVSSDDGFGLTLTNRAAGTGFYLEYPGVRGASDTLGVFQVPAPGDYELRLVYFERGGGSTVELFAGPGVFEAWSTAEFRLVGDLAEGGLEVRSEPVGGSGTGYRPYIATDVQSSLKDLQSSLYARIPFTLTEIPPSLFLSLQYDDGFVAYLNGQEVARRNAPTTPAWDSAATNVHPASAALRFESVNLSDQLATLRTGDNVLALHALNLSPGDTDFLLSPELLDILVTVLAPKYFSTPSPGEVNNEGFVAFVGDTRFTVDRGFYTEPFDVEITTSTPGANIYWTTDGTSPSPTNGTLYVAPIPIGGTTVLRAAAYLDGYNPSDVDTQSYLFPDDIIRQSPTGAPPPGWPSNWGANTVDYGMDPNIVDGAQWSGLMHQALTNLPSFSIVMKLEDLFDRTTGIYANPGQDGRLWERPCSVEYIFPDGTPGFQINAGVRIRGGFSRSTSNPKHAFRLFFRSDYGPPKLRYPIFGDAGTDTFDAIDLRTFQNYSWSFQGDGQGIFVRDQVNRDLQLAMGHQGERGTFCHLYINGQYWGLYNTCERPEASYGATYYGGNKEDYDVIKVEAGPYTINATDGNLDAWRRLYQLAQAGFASDAAYQYIQGNNPDGTPNPAYPNLVDVDNLIDYMLIILYGGNLDAPISNFLGNTRPNNFYGVRNRTGAYGGFRFFVHDAEHTLLNVNQDRTGPWTAGDSSIVYSNPQWIWQKLQANPEFRLRVADHVHRHFFNDGLLTPAGVSATLQRRGAEIRDAVVAESARWGDAKTEPALNRNNWDSTFNSVLNNYVPNRSGIVLEQLRRQELYPDTAAPTFTRHGGNVDPGFVLGMTAPAGSIVYTLDGSDPRLPGGGIAASARSYTGAFPLNRSTTVSARAAVGSAWSALTTAHFTLIRTWTNLFITEVMYHPQPDPTGLLDADEFEFLELKNVGPNTLDLGGVRFAAGVNYAFPEGSELAPGQFALLVANPTAFAQRYPGVPYDGVYTGRLNNGGETLHLVHAAGATIFSATYQDAAPWPPTPDGTGFSLVPAQPDLNPDPNLSTNWRASSTVGGSPGADDPGANLPPVWITEVLTHTDLPQLDSIELHNPNPFVVDISHWYLTDQRSTPKKFQIPANTTLAPGGYALFDEQDFNPIPGIDPSFNLSSHGEEVYLFSGDAAGNLTGFSDGFAFDAAANGVSFGRYTVSTGGLRYPAQTALTLGTPNTGPRVGPVVLSEIHYHPALGDTEFVELMNITDQPVPLYHPGFPTNTWQVEGIDFRFPQGVTLPPHGLTVIVEGNPDVFRARYSVPPEVPVFGPFDGVLQNNGENLVVRRPDAPDVDTNGVVVIPMIAVDGVRFSDLPPWPAAADGTGASLERILTSSYGDDPANWRASPGQPSPGFDNSGNRPPIVQAPFDVQNEVDLFPVVLQLAGTTTDDGLPIPPGRTTVRWSQIDGPGPVVLESPDTPSTQAIFPGIGTYTLRLSATDGTFATSDDTIVTLTRSTVPAPLIAQGSVWKYWDQGNLPGPDWAATSFNDLAWPSGPAQLGYNDGDEITPIGFGPDPNNKYITTWFRHAFNVTAVDRFSGLTVSVLRDDGAVAYLNGQEIFRSNMPESPIDETTRASSTVSGADESVTFYSTAVDPDLLREGLNVLAVEIHQVLPDSSDISFDLSLTGDALPLNTAPAVSAGPDTTVAVNTALQIQGSVSDEGLPIPPGWLTFGWSQTAGPSPAQFNNPGFISPTVVFPEPGTYQLQLAASDGSLSSSDTLTITVSGESYVDWQMRVFTAAERANPAISGPDADPDGDTHTNTQEYTAGTHPMNPLSVLHFTRVERTRTPPAETRLQFPAAAGRSYTLQYRPDLPAADWQRLADVPPGTTDETVEVIDRAAGGDLTRFYRIITPLLP